jgi:hypothetical protein
MCYLGNSIVVDPQLSHKGFQWMVPWWVSTKTHDLACVVDMIVTLGTCSKWTACMFYKPTYISLHLLSAQWSETNVSHRCYANY